MPIPATGWLATINNTNTPPEASPLPVAAEFTYSDGPTSYDTVPETPVEAIVLATGLVDVETGVGTLGGEYGFFVIMRQHATFGVLLLDYINPPVVPTGLPEPDPEDPVDVADDVPIFDPLTIEACCLVFLGWTFNGDVIFNGLKKFGADI